MSAEILRRAAALMRERAEGATGSPWRAVARMVVANPGPSARYVADCFDEDSTRPDQDHSHIASWHPDVALAVADALDDLANDAEAQAAEGYEIGPRHPLLTVARLYLGEAADD